MKRVKQIKKWLSRIWLEAPSLTWNRVLVRLGLKKVTNIETHIWCLSTGRVGTKTISELLTNCKNIKSLHEPEPKLFALGERAYLSNENNINTDLSVALNTCRNSLTGLSQNIYLESSPQVTFLARYLDKTFSNSKFIHVVRHPIEVVESGMKRKWYGGNFTDQWRISPSIEDPYFSRWKNFDIAEKNIWAWVRTNEWIEKFSSEIDSKKFLVIDSQDLFDGNEIMLNKLFEFIEIESLRPSVISKVLGKKINSNEANGFKESKILEQKHLKFMQDIGGELLQKYNFKIQS